MSEETPGTPQEPTPSAEQPVQPEPAPSGQVGPEDRTMGMLCHLLGLIGILGPLIIWLIKKDQSAFVNDQGKEAVNFHINLIIAFVALGIISGILSMIPVIGWLFGIILWLAMVAIGIFALVQIIMAAMQANNGTPYRYPFKVDIIK